MNIRILLIVLSFNSTSNLMLSQCEVVPEIITHYDEQVYILALEEMLQSGSADTNSIIVREEYTTPVFEALGTIFRSGFTEVVDSVFNIYCINNFSSDEFGVYRAHQMYVNLDTSVAWTQSWLNEIPVSGNPIIDSLLFGLDYEVELFVPTLLDGIVKITFQDVINLPVLVSILNTLEGIHFAERVPQYGDGSCIKLHNFGDEYQFDFVLGWDDCFSGCISYRVWVFSVTKEGCLVEYLGAYGSPVTFWYNEPPYAPNCQITATSNLTNIAIKIYPNPVNDVLRVESEHNLKSIEIFDMLGRSWLNTSLHDPAYQIDLHYLHPGLYYLNIDQQIWETFIKE